MSKQDQAASIAAKELADRICKAIMRNGDKRAQEERERCIECVEYSKRATQIVHHAGMCDAIIEAIRKGKA